MSRVRKIAGMAVLVLLVLTMTAGVSFAAQSIGAKVWFAEWESMVSGSFSDDLGDAAMIGIQYNFIPEGSSLVFSGQIGWGSGWEFDSGDASLPKSELDRTDLLFTVSGRSGCFYYGAGYYYMLQSADGKGYWVNWDGLYHGPELLAGVVLPLGESGFSVGISGLYLPVLFYTAETEYDDRTEKVDGETYAYGFDVNIGMSAGNWRFAAGYREQDIESDEGISDDNFGGPYVAGAVSL